MTELEQVQPWWQQYTGRQPLNNKQAGVVGQAGVLKKQQLPESKGADPVAVAVAAGPYEIGAGGGAVMMMTAGEAAAPASRTM
jgi:hypothetical protein